MRSRGTTLQLCPRPPCSAHMQAEAHGGHTLAHSQTHNSTWDQRPSTDSKGQEHDSHTEQTLLPPRPGFYPSAHLAPFSLPALGSPPPRTLHLSSKHRARVFSPSFNPALSLFLKKQALHLPGLSTLICPRPNSKALTTHSVSSATQGGGLRVLECWYGALMKPRPTFPGYIGETEVRRGEGTCPEALKGAAKTPSSSPKSQACRHAPHHWPSGHHFPGCLLSFTGFPSTRPCPSPCTCVFFLLPAMPLFLEAAHLSLPNTHSCAQRNEFGMPSPQIHSSTSAPLQSRTPEFEMSPLTPKDAATFIATSHTRSPKLAPPVWFNHRQVPTDGNHDAELTPIPNAGIGFCLRYAFLFCHL